MSPILNQGEHAGNVLVIRDITERRIAEERALVLRLEKERIHLLAGVIRDTSNELRAPLTMILNTISGTLGNRWYLLSAAAFISIALPVAVFISLQRYFVRGLLAGGTKG